MCVTNISTKTEVLPMARTRCQLLMCQLSACRDVVCVKLYNDDRAVIFMPKRAAVLMK